MMKRLRHDVGQHGAVAVLVALILVVLIGAAGIVLDLGRLFVAKTELQNAVDACALAAARELTTPGTPNMLARAENAGIRVGEMHRFDFQDVPVQFVAGDITFSTRLFPFDNVRVGGAAENIKYVRCTRVVPGFVPWFMKVFGTGSNVVGATAVAQARAGNPTCKIPLGLCKADGQTLTIGQWYSGRFSSSDGISGHFNWIDFNGGGGGAQDVREGLEGCLDVPTPNIGDSIPGETGMMQTAQVSWNSRFGIYKKGAGNPSPETGATCDKTGYAYTSDNSDGHDVFSDYVSKESGSVPYQGPKIPGFSETCDYQRGETGRRLVTLPVIDCQGWPNVVFKGWACALMLAPLAPPTDDVVLEYRGMAGDEGVPCLGFGGPGGPGPLVPTLVQ